MTNDKKIFESGMLNYRNKKRKEARDYFLFSFVGITVFVLIWYIVVKYELINVRNLPSPVEVLKTFVYKLSNKNPDGNVLWVNVLASLQVSLSGLILALFIGIPLGLIMGWYKPADKFVRPIFELLRPVPPIAWIPVVVVFVGIDLKAKAMIIFLSVLVPCVINSYAGIQQTRGALINVAKTFGGSSFYTFLTVGIPSSLPMVFAGVRVALGGAWSTLVAAEMLAAKAGLGYMLQVGRNVARADVVLVGMVTIGILGALMTGLLSLLEKFVLKWKIRD